MELLGHLTIRPLHLMVKRPAAVVSIVGHAPVQNAEAVARIYASSGTNNMLNLNVALADVPRPIVERAPGCKPRGGAAMMTGLAAGVGGPKWGRLDFIQGPFVPCVPSVPVTVVPSVSYQNYSWDDVVEGGKRIASGELVPTSHA